MTIRSFITCTARFVPVALALTLLACGDDDLPPVDVDSGGPRDAGGGGGLDAGPPRDGGGGGDIDASGGDVDAGGGDVDAGGSTGCGTERPDVSAIRGTEGLVIGRDGTIYYSQARAVGRLVPGGTPENGWASLGSSAGTVWGLALDATNENLYAGSPSAGSIFKVEVATATVTTLLPGAGSPNGLTMGPDGAVWYTDFMGGRAYRVDVGTGTRTMVTTTSITSPNGIAFGPDGRLYVESYGTGRLFALDLTADVESGRTMIAMGLGSPDGLAFDSTGQIYVGDNGGGRLLRLAADGTGPMTLAMSIGAAANVEFGSGALSCSDIYVASSGSLRRYEMGTITGAAVPWH